MSNKIIDISNGAHQPVLLKEVIHYLAPKPGEIVIDGTIGLGGHSELLLQKILPAGRLIGIDLDCQSLALAQKRLLTGEKVNSLDLFCDNFANIGDIIGKLELKGADVILLDLGVSSYQLDTPERGFSFMADAPLQSAEAGRSRSSGQGRSAPLDMRMSLAPQGVAPRGEPRLLGREARLNRRPDNPVNASVVVNNYPEAELERIFRSYGEERFAGRIAQRIVKCRQKEKITTTGQLVEIIKKAAPSGWKRIHPATRVFQALRIEVNKELENLERFLAGPPERPVSSGLTGFPIWLKPGGRVGIISFHSLEDRLVKNSFREYQKQGVLEILTRKPITPAEEEKKQNPRSRSAKFRVAVKK
ncbi:MAG: 16S rRNA (cytosine(1402)-N(4))-methyltransferase RsmH [Planctomycetota bacterium]